MTIVEQQRQALATGAAALPAGKASLEQWLACAAMLADAGEEAVARTIHQALAIARSRLAHMPPPMRAALQGAGPLDLFEILIGIGAAPVALDLLGALKRICGDSGDLYFQLGTVYALQGDAKRAIAAFQAALERDPAHADAHLRLAYLLCEAGQVGEGFAHFMTRARMVGGLARDNADAPRHKQRHDAEQRDFLAAMGVPPGDFHLGDGARIAGPAINPAHTEEILLPLWRDASPQYVVLDEFLTAGALDRLRSYCLESTVWQRIYEAGYIGAIPADGFACPLLAQLAEDIATRWPRIFGPHKFKYLGAFKYDSELSRGTNIHADLAAINVNFYITPDDANLDPQSGGMAIWNQTIDTEPLMRQLNSNESAMQSYIAARKAVQTRVPHRSNRAVIFKSSLIHKTDDCAFKTGYENKRINVSLLFGDYGASTRV